MHCLYHTCPKHKRNEHNTTHVEAGEVSDDGPEPLADGFLRELNLPHVEGPNPADLVARVNHRRGFALRERGGEGDVGRGDYRLREGTSGCKLLQLIPVADNVSMVLSHFGRQNQPVGLQYHVLNVCDRWTPERASTTMTSQPQSTAVEKAHGTYSRKNKPITTPAQQNHTYLDYDMYDS